MNDNTRIARWLDAGSEMDDLCASAENMLLHHGRSMTPDDWNARSKVVATARALIDDYYRDETDK